MRYNEIIMYTIVGLGNPGEQYERTRHNIAWIVLQTFIKERELPALHPERVYASDVTAGEVFGTDVLIVFPSTFMNHSGTAVKKVMHEHPEATLVVVHDDVALPLGSIRVALNRGAGGHNGVKSIITELGSKNFIRVRVGVAERNLFGVLKRPASDRLASFVLKKFSVREEKALSEIEKRVERALELIFTRDVSVAMNEMNSV